MFEFESNIESNRLYILLNVMSYNRVSRNTAPCHDHRAHRTKIHALVLTE